MGRWIAVAATLAVIGLLCVVPISCRDEPGDILRRIPIGSRLSELDKHLGTFYDSSQVTEWLPSKKGAVWWKLKNTRYGSFYVHELGSYDAWRASMSARGRFTGELSFAHHSWVIPDDLDPSYAISLTYVEGVLKEKRYTYLPG